MISDHSFCTAYFSFFVDFANNSKNQVKVDIIIKIEAPPNPIVVIVKLTLEIIPNAESKDLLTSGFIDITRNNSGLVNAPITIIQIIVAGNLESIEENANNSSDIKR
ncbi:hypothetical protein [Candidatus Uabimicrobium sp. HlEnr_7]|uniref:hypothetical protein n=1 Tax=Candidatus Uabimicrobium helgolandensis TaxID=3095367 RepID=UPI0035565D1C